MQFASRLPMRNWNLWLGIHRQSAHASRLPMRNWNHHGMMNVFHSHIASRLPMRNWNLVSPNQGSHRILFASRLPMRNWNLSKVKSLKVSCSFQTTYEELKPQESRRYMGTDSASRLPMRNWNSEPHYRAYSLSDSGFQTTYEELKLE